MSVQPRIAIKDCCRVVGGTTPDSKSVAYWNGDIVWITPTDLGKLSLPHITDSARRITRVGFESCGLEIVPCGTLLISSRAPIGHLGIAKVPLCFNQGCKGIVPSSQVDSDYLYYALKYSVPELQAMGSGATFAEISKAKIEDFRICVPPLAEQKRIAAKLSAAMEEVERARVVLDQQRSLLDSLSGRILAEAFEGS